MSELVYPPVVATARGMFRALDMRLTVLGSQHVPTSGPAILASTHVSYLDFILVGLGAQDSRRLVRFMAKQSVFAHPVSGPLMRGMHHIPVDRKAGSASYAAALEALRAGEVLGVFPEATISRSFTVKELKTGAARMALATGAPLVPMVVWGTQRLWTKGRPRALGTRHVPITVALDPPVPVQAGDTPTVLTARLAGALTDLLVRVQHDYPDAPSGPDDAWWLPSSMGGTAPTPAQARALDAAEDHLG